MYKRQDSYCLFKIKKCITFNKLYYTYKCGIRCDCFRKFVRGAKSKALPYVRHTYCFKSVFHNLFFDLALFPSCFRTAPPPTILCEKKDGYLNLSFLIKYLFHSLSYTKRNLITMHIPLVKFFWKC